MTQSEPRSPPRRCPRCGAELPSHVSAEGCPKCLLRVAMETQPAAGLNGTVVVPEPEAKLRGLPQPGEQLGHYHIIRRLGAGGMGAVFDAEDRDSGRRVALKVLSQMLDSPEARQRFLREGRLAASINHPNSVYVFGTEEIGGTPVISMERVAGGTLQDRVQQDGPFPVGRAVDATLQIIAGLEAAQRLGVLHRDVKPSNCFVDADGTVKIGDFGLSIASTIRTEPALTSAGTFLGTPAFCSPEQLRGDEINARSDLYSVGATLFYLLTGRTPFEGKHPVQLLATVLEQRAPSPTALRREIPPGLSRVVLRCLEKLPGDRFATYDELRQALAPYSGTAPTPATLGFRFLAGGLDLLLFNLVGLVFLVSFFGNPMHFLELAFQRSPRALAAVLAMGGLSILYYALSEGLRGASPGKALCGLRVVGPDRGVPGLRRAAVRAALFVLLPPLPYWLVYGANPTSVLNSSPTLQGLMGMSFYLVLALLFLTMRRRNGFAALHDRVSGTRVISRLTLPSRPTLTAVDPPPPAADTLPTVGPYHVLETLEQSEAGQWLLAFDLQLLRKIWVRTVPAGTSPVAPHLRDLSRVGRLRWIAGRRTLAENWDAFEAVTGRPLLRLLAERQPWERVRYWLHDLATEIRAAEQDGTLPAVLALDRVWITGDGRAKLLDSPAPGGPPDPEACARSWAAPPPGAPPSGVAGFLQRVAEAALEGRCAAVPEALKSPRAVPLPLHARRFLDGLSQPVAAEAILAALTPLLQRGAVVSRARRLGIVGACLAVPVLAAIGMAFGLRVLGELQRGQPDVIRLSSLLAQREASRSPWVKGRSGPEDRHLALYIARHFGSTITNANTWSHPLVLSLINADSRRFAEQSVAQHSAPNDAELQEAETALKPFLATAQPPGFLQEKWFPVVAGAAALLVYVGFPALLWALLFRGGPVLWASGVAVVTRDGVRASRARVFWRALVAWSPLLLAPILLGGLVPFVGALPAVGLLGVLIAGLTVGSLALRQRSLQDRLAGTWLVPR